MAEGYQAPRCATCGHAEGTHRSNRAGFAGTLQFGPCLILSCDCAQFTPEPEADRAA